MAKIGKIIIDDFSGGWSSAFFKSSTTSEPATKRGTYYSGLFNINKTSLINQISPPITNNASRQASISALPINAIRTSNNLATFILRDGTMPELNLTLTWAPGISNNWSAPASCTTDDYKDIWSHVDSTGAENIMFTYQTGANAFLGFKYSNTATGRNDTYYTFANRNVPHVGCVSVANRSYITDKNFVRVYDPITGMSAGVNVGNNYTCKSVADYGNYVAIVGDDGKNARMWLWDGTTEFPNFQYEIRDNYVTAVVNRGGILHVFTYGKNNSTKIKIFNGVNFGEEADWETPTTQSASPAHNMVDVWLNQITWKTPDGYIWTYGSPKTREIQAGAHRIGKIDTDTTGNGCVRNLYQDQLFCGSQNGGTNYIDQILGSNPYQSTLPAVYKSTLFTVPHKSTIETIHLYFSYMTIPNGGQSPGITVNLYAGYETTDLLNFSMPTDTAAPVIGLRHYPIKAGINDIDTFYIVYTSNGNNNTVTLKKIEVDYVYENNL